MRDYQASKRSKQMTNTEAFANADTAPRAVIMIARENDRATLESGIGHFYSAPVVEVDEDVDVYFECPHGPKWMNEDQLVTVARAIVAGDI
jgi:hypothetical protein